MRKNQKAYAVIFGIEDYMLESNVNYSQNSAMMFMQYANKLLGVPDDNIWAFVGNKTSSGFIKSQWNDFLSLVEDDAVVYFYYSGHGVPGNDGNAYILPSDTNAETATNDKTFMLKNIYSNLSKTKAKKVVAFVDSCFSGKDDKGSLLFDGVAPVLKVKKTTFDKEKMTIFTAGSSKNFSNQYKEKKHRLFSYFLMKGLAQGKTNTKELFGYVKKNVANKSRKLV
ncbi:MAG: caspase family protein [Campylobacterota bacterium]|nr:caspase family protein [Campylobacterota bacterium]